MKRRILFVISIFILLLSIPLSLIASVFLTPPVFDETYYGELKYMYDRLTSATKKKIVLVGNSSVAFGVRTDLLERELPDYEVISFGLYGAIGTKAMMDISKANISEGDIVLLITERDLQAQSLYFSAENTWMATDGNFEILKYITDENMPQMVGNFPHFASQKFTYLSKGEKPSVAGVYTQASFNDESGNEVGYMTYERAHNVMTYGFDVNDHIDYTTGLDEDFVSYVNEYNRFVTEHGATLYFGFSPVNKLALNDETNSYLLDRYYDKINAVLDCPILGNPWNYMLDYEWFYDTNFHLNSAGMFPYTDLLASDLKAILGISSPNQIAIPEKPTIPPSEIIYGNDEDADCFIYEDFEGGLRIVGLTDEGATKVSLTIPTTFGDKPVLCFSESAFSGNKVISEIIVQENIKLLYDNSFDGCTRLTKLVIQHGDPNSLGVGTGLTIGAEQLRIYVQSSIFDLFSTHYNWGAYRNVLKTY